MNEDIKVWADAQGDDSWFRRFLNYLRAHGHANDLAFMSYEHYPFRGCDQGVTLRMDLLREPAVLRGIMDAWWADGLPKSVPTYITEVNFANNGGPVPKQVEGALWMADWIGTGLSHGLAGLNHYQYETEPMDLNHQCGKWGGYTMFVVDQKFRVLANAAQYYSAQMITQHWLQPGNDQNEIYPVTTDQTSKNPSVTAYAAERPDATWSVMVVNKDAQSHAVRIEFDRGGDVQSGWAISDVASFGIRQYHWNGDSATETPAPNSGIALASAVRASDGNYDVPPLSITVFSGLPTVIRGMAPAVVSSPSPGPSPRF